MVSEFARKTAGGAGPSNGLKMSTSRRTSTMDLKRRALLAAGAAVAATTAVPRVLGQQTGSRGKGKFYEKSSVRIYYRGGWVRLPPHATPARRIERDDCLLHR